MAITVGIIAGGSASTVRGTTAARSGVTTEITVADTTTSERLLTFLGSPCRGD